MWFLTTVLVSVKAEAICSSSPGYTQLLLQDLTYNYLLKAWIKQFPTTFVCRTPRLCVTASCIQSVSISCPLSLQNISRVQPLLATSTLGPRAKPLSSLTGIEQILSHLSASTLTSAPSVYSQHTSWNDTFRMSVLQQEWNAWCCSNPGVGIRRPDF